MVNKLSESTLYAKTIMLSLALYIVPIHEVLSQTESYDETEITIASSEKEEGANQVQLEKIMNQSIDFDKLSNAEIYNYLQSLNINELIIHCSDKDMQILQNYAKANPEDFDHDFWARQTQKKSPARAQIQINEDHILLHYFSYQDPLKDTKYKLYPDGTVEFMNGSANYTVQDVLKNRNSFEYK